MTYTIRKDTSLIFKYWVYWYEHPRRVYASRRAARRYIRRERARENPENWETYP